MEEPVYADVYSIPEAARALGKTDQCLKKWIKDGIVPRPVLRDTTKGYKQYARGEVEAIARQLSIHEREFSYLSNKHTATVHAIWQAVQSFRSSGAT